MAIYTPLKTRTPLNTAVGAVSGALPILIGWTATGTAIDMRCWALVAVMFLWQFPHFMAIAWLYREDYARGGQRMLTVVDPTGLRAAGQAIVAAMALVPVSLVPALVAGSGQPTCLQFLDASARPGPSRSGDVVYDAARRHGRALVVAGEPGLSHMLDGSLGDGRRVAT